MAGTEVYVGYFLSPTVTSSAVWAFKANSDGSLLWGPVLLSSEILGGKDDLEMTVNTENRAFYAWGDSRNDFSDIYAQNINADGTLGNPGTFPVSVTLTPINPPVLIPATGGSFEFNATLDNSASSSQTFDVWIMVQLPSGAWYGPALGPLTLTLPPNFTLTRVRTQSVPGSAPAGDYWYQGRIGDYPGTISDSSGFAFTKLTTGDGLWVSHWSCTGEEMARKEGAQPYAPTLLCCTPNPFNPSTTLSYQLSANSYVHLRVYDTAGRLVTTLVDGWRSAGEHQLTWDAGDLAAGMYFARLEAGEYVGVQKLALIK
jgi:hypothetical protein